MILGGVFLYRVVSFSRKYLLTLIISCRDDILPILAGSGEGDVSEGFGNAGGNSLGLGGAALFAPLYAGKEATIGVGLEISGLLRSPGLVGGNGAAFVG